MRPGAIVDQLNQKGKMEATVRIELTNEGFADATGTAIVSA